MKKTTSLYIVLVFLAGGLMGYSGLLFSHTQNQKSHTSFMETNASGRSSGLKLTRSKGASSLPSENTLTSYLLKYAEFSPQETKAELERLLKAQKEDKKHNYALYQSIQYLAFKLAGQSPEEAKRLLEDKSNQERSSLYSALVEGWADQDPQGAMSYLLAHKKDFERSPQIFKTLTKNMVTQDAEKAMTWISTLTPGERDTALEAMSASMPKLHPEKMKEFLAVLSRQERSSYQITSNVSANWAVSDWDAFKAWADTLKGNRKELALSRAFSRLAETDLDKATEEFKKTDKKKRDEIARDIIQGMDYEKKSEGKALDWVLENRDSFSNLPDTVENAMSDSWCWEGITPQLTEKVFQLPEGALRDSALSGLIKSQTSVTISGEYEESTNNKYTQLLSLSEKIGDAKKRDDTTRECVERWIDKSPEKARQWITEKSSFSNEVKQKLYQQCDNNKKQS